MDIDMGTWILRLSKNAPPEPNEETFKTIGKLCYLLFEEDKRQRNKQ